MSKLLSKELGDENIRAHRQVRAVFFKGTDGKDHRRALAVERVEPREADLGKAENLAGRRRPAAGRIAPRWSACGADAARSGTLFSMSPALRRVEHPGDCRGICGIYFPSSVTRK